MAKSVSEICEAISADWKARRITHQIAADKIGTTKQSISNVISGKKKRISVNLAQKLSEAFGYDERFLLYGEGELYAEGHGVMINGGRNEETGLPQLYYIGYQDEPFKYGRQLRVAERIIEILNNKVAISAFHAYMNEQYDEYADLIEILESDYAYRSIIHGVKPEYLKTLKAIRQWFTDVETKAAKELVIIEQKAAAGELNNVEAEIERFRMRVLQKKDAFKEEAKSRHPEIDLEKYMPEQERQELLKMMPDEKKE